MDKILNILIDSQHKKLGLLDEIMAKCDELDRCLASEIPDIDCYNELMREKKSLIDKMTQLDDGFVALYERVSPGLRENAGLYAGKLKELKALVTDASSRTALIQARELRTRARIDKLAALSTTQTSFKPARADAARKYNNVMNKTTRPRSIFVDRKK